MAIYPVIHVDTGEKKVVEMSVNDIMQWYKDNPEWKRDWSEGCATPGEVGDLLSRHVSRNPGWNDVLRKVSKVPGANVKPI